MDWTPTIEDRTGPVYLRIVEALAADIGRGRLRRGEVLPTHRALAKALHVDLTTVTRAYAEAKRRGLTEARVGQGTFVTESAGEARLPPIASAEIDLSMNLPPQPAEADIEGRVARGIATLSREVGLARYLTYRPAGGSDDERAVAATWMRARLPDLDPDRLVISGGTQAALAALLGKLTKPGNVVLTELLTYPGFRAAAAFCGGTLAGVTMDERGVMPDALAAACRRHKPRLVYLTPTIHNPTAASMTPTRRRQIAAVIEKANVLLIEDDAYGRLDAVSPPIAALIPERPISPQACRSASRPDCGFRLLRRPIVPLPTCWRVPWPQRRKCRHHSRQHSLSGGCATGAPMPSSPQSAPRQHFVRNSRARRWPAMPSRQTPMAITSG
jgi:DNA-binding transcriptional MocR family regulator